LIFVHFNNFISQQFSCHGVEQGLQLEKNMSYILATQVYSFAKIALHSNISLKNAY